MKRRSIGSTALGMHYDSNNNSASLHQRVFFSKRQEEDERGSPLEMSHQAQSNFSKHLKKASQLQNNHSSSQTILRIRPYEFSTDYEAQIYYNFVDMLARYLPDVADQIAEDAASDAKEVMKTIQNKSAAAGANSRSRSAKKRNQKLEDQSSSD
jgi:hypothetical protein